MAESRYEGFKASRVGETSWHIIIVFIFLDMASVALINLVVFPSGILDVISRASFGILNSTLVVNILIIAGLVYLLMIRFGKLTWADLGIKKGRLTAGITATLTIWTLMQMINMSVGLMAVGTPVLYSGWQTYGVSAVFGAFIVQIFGNALFEELAFRGFLMPQLCKKIKSKKSRIVSAVLLSQIIFGLMHVPNRIYNGTETSQMVLSIVIPAALGILFAVVYIVTDNLFLAIGIHALVNMPIPVFEGLNSFVMLISITIILLVIWPFTFGKVAKKVAAVPEEVSHA